MTDGELPRHLRVAPMPEAGVSAEGPSVTLERFGPEDQELRALLQAQLPDEFAVHGETFWRFKEPEVAVAVGFLMLGMLRDDGDEEFAGLEPRVVYGEVEPIVVMGVHRDVLEPGRAITSLVALANVSLKALGAYQLPYEP